MDHRTSVVFDHVAHPWGDGQVGESVKSAGIFAQEKGFVCLGELRSLLNEIQAHFVGDGGHSPGVIAAPHEFVKTHQIGGFPDGPDSGGIGVKFFVEQPGDAAAFDEHVFELRQADLLQPAVPGHHAEVADGDPQIRELLGDLPQSAGLRTAVRQVDGDEFTVGIGQLEGGRMAQKVLIFQAAGAQLDAVETFRVFHGRFFVQRADPKPLAVLRPALPEVGILVAVDVFLGDHGTGDTGVVHVGQKTFGGVDTVGHIGGHHLPDLAAKITAAAADVMNGAAVDPALLFGPQVGMSVNDHSKPPWDQPMWISSLARVPSLLARALKAARASSIS